MSPCGPSGLRAAAARHEDGVDNVLAGLDRATLSPREPSKTSLPVPQPDGGPGVLMMKRSRSVTVVLAALVPVMILSLGNGCTCNKKDDDDKPAPAASAPPPAPTPTTPVAVVPEEDAGASDAGADAGKPPAGPGGGGAYGSIAKCCAALQQNANSAPMEQKGVLHGGGERVQRAPQHAERAAGVRRSSDVPGRRQDAGGLHCK